MIPVLHRRRPPAEPRNGCGTLNPLICVCPTPVYGCRLDGCRRCGRPPLPGPRLELGLYVPKEGPWAA